MVVVVVMVIMMMKREDSDGVRRKDVLADDWNIDVQCVGGGGMGWS